MRRPGARIDRYFGAAIVVLLVIPALLAWSRRAGATQWQRFQSVAAAAQAETDARDALRPVLWGEAQEGDAWPHYERALAGLPAAAAVYLEYLIRVEGARLRRDPSTEQVRAGPPASDVVAAHAAALAALRAGAHMGEARRPMRWEMGFRHPWLTFLETRHLANASVLAAFLAAADGNGSQTVRLLLDALQLGRDLLQSPLQIEQGVGCVILDVAGRNAVASSHLLCRLDGAALREFGAGLARLDAQLPLHSCSLASEAVLLARHFAHPRGHEHVTEPRGPRPPDGVIDAAVMEDPTFLGWRGWRYGWSGRLALAEHGLTQLQFAARMKRLCEGPNAVDPPGLERLFAERHASPNPLTCWWGPNLRTALRNRLEAIAGIRLLRMAVQHATGERVTALPDPAGGTLHWSVGEDAVAEFWSTTGRGLRLRVPRSK